MIQDIVVYKFPERPRQEIEAMFGLEELRKTRYYQEVAEEERMKGELEGKLKAVPRLASLKLTAEQIAEALELDLKLVQKALKSSK